MRFPRQRRGRVRLSPRALQFSAASGRPAAENFGWLIADRFVRLVLNVGIGIWVARHLGPSQFGALSYALAAVAVMQPLAEMGLDAIVRREFLNRPEDAEATAAATLWIRLLGGTLSGILLLVSLPLGWAAGQEKALVAVLSLLLLQPSLAVPEVWMQAHLQARAVAPRQWGALLAGASIRVCLVLADAPLVSFAVALVIETALGGVLVARTAGRLGFRIGRAYGPVAAALLRQAWPLMLAGLATLVYMRIDVLMLRRMIGSEETGLYVAGTRFAQIWFFLPAALAASVLPGLLRAREAGQSAYATRLQTLYDANVALAYGIALPTCMVAAWLVDAAYGAHFAGAAPVLQVSAWSLPFVFLGVARGQFLANERHMKFYLASTTAGLVINIALNLLLIPRYGATGAAWATLAAQATAAWLTTFCFAPARANAWMQLRALLIPFRFLRYVRSR